MPATLFIYLSLPHRSNLRTHCSDILFLSRFPFSFSFTSLPTLPSRALAKCAKLASCFFSPPRHPLRIQRVYYKLPHIQYLHAQILSLAPTPKAINLQRVFLTKTPSPPTGAARAHTLARARIHTHTPTHIPHPFFSLTFAKISQTCSNKCLKAPLENATVLPVPAEYRSRPSSRPASPSSF